MPVTEQDRLPIVVEGITWIPVTRPYDPAEGWVCKGFGSFSVADYGADNSIFQGFCALHNGCGVNVKNQPTHLAAMKGITPRIRAHVADELQRERRNLRDLEERAAAIGITEAD